MDNTGKSEITEIASPCSNELSTWAGFMLVHSIHDIAKKTTLVFPKMFTRCDHWSWHSEAVETP